MGFNRHNEERRRRQKRYGSNKRRNLQDDSRPGGGGQHQQKPPADRLASEKFDADGKRFFLDLECNTRGMFLKIKEVRLDSGDARSSVVMVPSSGLADFRECVTRIAEYAAGSAVV